MLPRKVISYFNLRRSVIIIFTLLIIMRLCERERRSTPLPPQTQAYLEQYAPIAVAAGEETGVPPTIMLAVAGLESAWGTSELAKKGNNHFGIKAEASQPRYCPAPPANLKRGFSLLM
ncbi:MAG: glucosaminidase domain-containing protein [Saprospiraceae bacterium]|nr:glucosaminidase domain-containing protein [Saprospiraceae bacterium]